MFLSVTPDFRGFPCGTFIPVFFSFFPVAVTDRVNRNGAFSPDALYLYALYLLFLSLPARFLRQVVAMLIFRIEAGSFVIPILGVFKDKGCGRRLPSSRRWLVLDNLHSLQTFFLRDIGSKIGYGFMDASFQ